MPRVLTCPRGHQWQEAEESAFLSDPASCPVCGIAIPQLREEPTSTGGAAFRIDSAPTVLHHGPWQPLYQYSEPAPNLPDFDFLGEIGRGGMGVVYKARHRGEEQIVAVKVIRKDRLQHEEAVRRFRREAQAAARVCHPNVVHVMDSDHTGDTHYLVMEFVDGVTLDRLVEVHGPLPVAQACDFMRQAALGLQHAAEQGLVHRDIKPSNLMVTPTPPASSLVVKVLDMGVALVLQVGGQSPGESLSTLTQGGSVIGTADFIAPEQLEDPHGADVRSDLYSLGCTFYFLLAGRVPFPGGSLISKLDKQRWHSPTPLNELREEIPVDVAKVVERLMAKKPADRFQNAGELVQTIEALAGNGFVSPSAPARRLKPVQSLLGASDVLWTVQFSPDGKRVAAAGKERCVQFWDLATSKLVRSLPKQPQEIRCLAYAPQGDVLATASGFTLKLWNVESGLELRRFSGHTGAIRCVTFTADCRRLVTGGDDKTVRVWDVPTGREIFRLARHAGAVTSVAVVNGANHLLTGSRDQTVRQWDLRNGQELKIHHVDAGAVLALAVSSDERRFATAHFDTALRLWDFQHHDPWFTLAGHKQMVSALAFARDSRYLLSAGQDHTLRLWEVDTGDELDCVPAHTAGIHALAMNADGSQVASAGGDKRICVFDVPG